MKPLNVDVQMQEIGAVNHAASRAEEPQDRSRRNFLRNSALLGGAALFAGRLSQRAHDGSSARASSSAKS